jgi:transposase-like protein
MAKYSAELTEKITELIEEKFFTISQVCKATGVSRQTFYDWMEAKEDFRREVDQATERRRAEFDLHHASLAEKEARRLLHSGGKKQICARCKNRRIGFQIENCYQKGVSAGLACYKNAAGTG